MSTLPTFTANGVRFVVVPATVAAKHGLGEPDPAVERQRAIGERLRAARAHAELSQSELAARLDWTQAAVSAAERGRDPISDDRAVAVLEALGLPADWTPPRRRSKTKR